MSRGRNLVLGWGLAMLGIAGFWALGSWQLGRMHEKQAMLGQVEAVLDKHQAVPLAVAGDASRARDYDWAAGEGRFADVPPVLYDNQQRGGRAGVLAYRLFQPEGAAPLLVELGWLPLGGARELPTVKRPAGVNHVQGLLAPPPSHGIGRVVIAPQPDGTLLTTGIEPVPLSAALGQPALPPRVLKLDPALPLGYARDLDILPNTLPPERHLGYAVTWFALALTVLVTAIILTVHKPRPRP